MFSTWTAVLSQHQHLSSHRYMFLSLTHIQFYFAQLSHLLYNITMCSFLYMDVVVYVWVGGGGLVKVSAPLKTSHRWLCSSLVCKNETEFCAKQKKSIQQLVIIRFSSNLLENKQSFSSQASGCSFHRSPKQEAGSAASLCGPDSGWRLVVSSYGGGGCSAWRWWAMDNGNQSFSGERLSLPPLSGDLEDRNKQR